MATCCLNPGRFEMPVDIPFAFHRILASLSHQSRSVSFERRAKEAPAPENWPHSLELSELGLEPAVDWASGLLKLGSLANPGRRAN